MGTADKSAPPRAVLTLALNIGNSSFLGGLYAGHRVLETFRLPSKGNLKGLSSTLGELVQRHGRPHRVALSTVVPGLTTSVLKLLTRISLNEPRLLTAKASHGLHIEYHDPLRLGTDRLAAMLGARSLSPDTHLLVVDCGTATTVTALDKRNRLRGGAIFPGIGLWADALAAQTAQLPRIEPIKTRKILGRSPEEAIASGLFHGHLGALRGLCEGIAREAFAGEEYLVYGTGGNAALFAKEKLFTRLHPSLILIGLLAFAASSNEHA